MTSDLDSRYCAAIKWLRQHAPVSVLEFEQFWLSAISVNADAPGTAAHTGAGAASEQGPPLELPDVSECLSTLMAAGVPLTMPAALAQIRPHDYIGLLPFDWLDAGQILAHVDQEHEAGGWPFTEVLTEPWIDSTQSWAQRRAQQKPFTAHYAPRAVLSEYQSQGRGRLQRQWVASMGQCLMMTVSLVVPRVALDQRISPAFAVLLCDWLNQHYGLPARVKWPNDLLCGGRKLAGFLVQTTSAPGQQMGDICLMMGLGVNLELPQAQLTAIGQPAMGLRDTGHDLPSKSHLAAQVLGVFARLCGAIRRQDWSFLSELWPQYDAYYQQPVRLLAGSEIIDGVNTGIDEGGQLLLATNGQINSYCVGEVSLRQP